MQKYLLSFLLCLLVSFNVNARDYGTSKFFGEIDERAGFKSDTVSTPIRLGDISNVTFSTTNQTIIGALNEVLSGVPAAIWSDDLTDITPISAGRGVDFGTGILKDNDVISGISFGEATTGTALSGDYTATSIVGALNEARFDQDLGSTDSPSFTGLTVSGLTDGLVSSATGVLSGGNSVDLTSQVSNALPIANGGTNSSAALTNGYVMISDTGAIVESSSITTTELGLLNGIASVSTGAGDNDKFVTQGYVDDSVGAVPQYWNRVGTVLTTTTAGDTVQFDADQYLNFDSGTGDVYIVHDSGTNALQVKNANGNLTLQADVSFALYGGSNSVISTLSPDSAIDITTGNAAGANPSGGINLTTGNTDSGASGDITMGAGTSVSGTVGRVKILATDFQLGSTGSPVNIVRDEDNMASDDAKALATQQSIKKYVDDTFIWVNVAGDLLMPTGGYGFGTGQALTEAKTLFFYENIGEAGGTDTNVDINLKPKGTGALSVAGTTNYETNVTDDDDIPNKKYVYDLVTKGMIKNIVTKAAGDSPYAPVATDFTILADTSGGNIEVDLPAAASSTGRVLTIKKIDAANTLTIDPNGSELIDGSSTSISISTQWDSYTIQCDGASWFIL